MNWQRPDRYYIETDEGYRVCVMYHREDAKYHAWAPRVHRDMPVCLGRFDTADEARAECERHHEGMEAERRAYEAALEGGR